MYYSETGFINLYIYKLSATGKSGVSGLKIALTAEKRP